MTRKVVWRVLGKVVGTGILGVIAGGRTVKVEILEGGKTEVARA